MSRPRVLLVDDDASIRRFVALALEDVEVELEACASVAQALEALRARGPVALVITDLMMPGENGLVLLRRLADEPALRGAARIAVFSAGLRGPLQAELAAHDVWRQLSKPVSVVELEACVRDAVGTPPTTPPRDAGADQAIALDDAARHAITIHFAGDRELYLAFRASAVAQFEADISRGDDDIARGDLSDLRHLAHSLKSVLSLLGHDDFAGAARRLEDCAERLQTSQVTPLWARLREGLAALVSRQRPS
ncbi:MAG TPA: response regulator [Rhizobacter sp.]